MKSSLEKPLTSHASANAVSVVGEYGSLFRPSSSGAHGRGVGLALMWLQQHHNQEPKRQSQIAADADDAVPREGRIGDGRDCQAAEGVEHAVEQTGAPH